MDIVPSTQVRFHASACSSVTLRVCVPVLTRAAPERHPPQRTHQQHETQHPPPSPYLHLTRYRVSGCEIAAMRDLLVALA